MSLFGLKYQRSAGEIAQALAEKFGHVVLGTDDDLVIGEVIPKFMSRGVTDSSVSGVVTGVTQYAEYLEQAEFLGLGGDCRDCFDHYFIVKIDKAVERVMTTTCTQCKRDFNVPVTLEQVLRWQSGELIQNVMPELTPDQRELLISQTCGECFDGMSAEAEGA